MKEILEVIAIILLFASFAFLHSFFALLKLKRFVRARYPALLPFYRITYNLISLFLFWIILTLSPHPDRVLYDLHYPYDIIVFMLQIIALAGIIWSFSAVEGSEFLGISQLIRYVKNSYTLSDLDERNTFQVKGPFRITRHPMYFFFILFLGLRPTMDLFYLTLYVCTVVYFYLGTFFEEKRLIEEFGERYIKYQQLVPRIIPLKVADKRELQRLIEQS